MTNFILFYAYRNKTGYVETGETHSVFSSDARLKLRRKDAAAAKVRCEDIA